MVTIGLGVRFNSTNTIWDALRFAAKRVRLEKEDSERDLVLESHHFDPKGEFLTKWLPYFYGNSGSFWERYYGKIEIEYWPDFDGKIEFDSIDGSSFNIAGTYKFNYDEERHECMVMSCSSFSAIVIQEKDVSWNMSIIQSAVRNLNIDKRISNHKLELLRC